MRHTWRSSFSWNPKSRRMSSMPARVSARIFLSAIVPGTIELWLLGGNGLALIPVIKSRSSDGTTISSLGTSSSRDTEDNDDMLTPLTDTRRQVSGLPASTSRRYHVWHRRIYLPWRRVGLHLHAQTMSMSLRFREYLLVHMGRQQFVSELHSTTLR